jgi:Rps23 Pro-64 3,4-dihydroxylase Tpa1-like proline 4-hydroxylase
MINTIFTEQHKQSFTNADPFPHIVFDNFFTEDVAKQLSDEIPPSDSNVWFQYNNKIENKYVCNHWDRFPALTYKVFSYLSSPEFTSKISELTGIFPLVADIGLHGGGWHVHTKGGLLNVHKDYSIHPKLKLERALNIIVYLTPDWDVSWGGGLGLWTEKDNQPDKLIQHVDCLFNRAVLFDTRKDSWHGLPEPIKCPEDKRRTSIALYYLTVPQENTDPRERALFAPSEWQKGDREIEEFIIKRSKA